MKLQAHAKINLSLKVLGKRPDGFHELTTRMVPLELHDEVSVELMQDEKGVVITSNDPTLPTGEENLMTIAVRALEQKTGVKRGWQMHVEKRIPSGAGLGGGSSDAAAVLRAVNELAGLGLSQAELVEVAGRIGSDVPFFLFDTACDATGRGEKLVPVEFPWRFDVLLLKPPFGIPTPWAYKNWASSKELASVSYKPQMCPWGEMVNDLERPVFEKYLLLPALKGWLQQRAEVEAAMMSGSGSTMYAILKEGHPSGDLERAAEEYCGEQTWICSTRVKA
jgi:4-diphosphocytidyl-2-C-methyl-D-erythritol kinase